MAKETYNQLSYFFIKSNIFVYIATRIWPNNLAPGDSKMFFQLMFAIYLAKQK